MHAQRSVAAGIPSHAHQTAIEQALWRGIVAGGLGTKAQGMAAKVLPDSVKAMGNRVMAKPRD